MMKRKRHYTPTEHRIRVAALSEMQNAVLQLPATATLHDVERALRGVFQQAVTEQAVQYVFAQLRPTPWQRIRRLFRRR